MCRLPQRDFPFHGFCLEKVDGKGGLRVEKLLIKHLRTRGAFKTVLVENKRKSSLEASDHDTIFSMKLSAGGERGAGAVDEIKSQPGPGSAQKSEK